MDNRQTEFLRRLLETPSPSGFEDRIQEIYYREVAEFSDSVETDVHGNVVAKLNGVCDRSILLAGHCDEIGLMVKHIDDKGYLYFSPIGGVDPLVLLGQRVHLFGPQGKVVGVVGRMPFHLQTAEDREKEKKIRFQDLWIDIGATDLVQAARVAPVGTPGVWGPETFHPMLGGMATARAFDDKVGMFVVVETLRRLSSLSTKPPFTVLGASTIQEECGVWGAGPIAYALEPEAAIAIDVTHATDYPGIEKKHHGDLDLGKGPVVTRGVKSSKVLNRLLEETASRHGIATQIQAEFGRFGTDADPMSDRRGGIPVNTLGIPLRYMHTATEMISLDDLDTAVDLLFETLIALDPKIDFRAFNFQSPDASTS